MNKFVQILEIDFTTLKENEVIELIRNTLNNLDSQRLFIATPNPEMLIETSKNAHFKNILQNTGLNLPDGNGLIWANKFNIATADDKNKILISIKGFWSLIKFIFQSKNEKTNFNKAIHGSDLMYKICLDKGLSTHKIFLLGNSNGLKRNTSELVKQNLLKRNQHINIIGNLDSTPTEDILEEIKQAKPEILFVAFGSPKQEIWLAENLPKLPSIKIAIGVGGSFDFIAGIIPRAPILMRKLGLEWLFRLYKQPKRIRRIINATIKFPIMVIASRLKDRR